MILIVSIIIKNKEHLSNVRVFKLKQMILGARVLQFFGFILPIYANFRYY